MQEQRTNYMSELDQWVNRSVIEPLGDAFTHGPEEVIVNAKNYVRKAIKEKVLESYHNGQKARPRAFQRATRR